MIHHTPDPAGCVADIARALKACGAASISVYYRNAILRHWHLFHIVLGLTLALRIDLKGRGREGVSSMARPPCRLHDRRKRPEAVTAAFGL